MTLAADSSPHPAPRALDIARLDELILVRIATGGPVGSSELARDLQPLVHQRLTSAGLRLHLEAFLARSITSGNLVRSGSRVQATDKGRTIARALIGGMDLPRSWSEACETALLAKVLGVAGGKGRIAALKKLDGLNAAIVACAFGLEMPAKPSASRIRSALALLALERAFGHQLKSGLDRKSGLSPKAGRLLAAQLSLRPRDYGTDSRLVAQLAAEAVGVSRGNLAALRLAVLRHFVSGAPWPRDAVHATAPARPSNARPRRVERRSPPAVAVPTAAEQAVAAPVAPPEAVSLGHRPVPVQRPCPAVFAEHVRQAARVQAEGWSGNRRAYISRVWSALSAARPEWGLSEIEFKAMLTEAHRAGLLALAHADLKDRRTLEEVQASAIAYKNAVWHFIRVED